ncbi:MAG: hypothetical protein NTZ35_01210 [Ignavibacteriales bacterium]|nr:hypothetical protein [Ignavibacteriales bacterium]
MIFEFLIVYHQSNGFDINTLLKEKLAEVLEDNLNEFDDAQIGQFVRLYLKRPCEPHIDENGVASTRTIIGFHLDLPDETANTETVISDLCGMLADTPPVVHILKFEDPLLLQKYRTYSLELYQIEMKLRKALSIVYLHSYSEDYYNLLRDETTKPLSQDLPSQEQMKKALENNFFHLTFHQYVELNDPKSVKKIENLIDVVRDSNTFDEFKNELERMPVVDEHDREFLASLKDKLEPIEKLRNSVAHNRVITVRVADNYAAARPRLIAELDEYLAHSYQCRTVPRSEFAQKD